MDPEESAMWKAIEHLKSEIHWAEQGHTDTDSLGTLLVSLQVTAQRVAACRHAKRA